MVSLRFLLIAALLALATASYEAENPVADVEDSQQDEMMEEAPEDVQESSDEDEEGMENELEDENAQDSAVDQPGQSEDEDIQAETQEDLEEEDGIEEEKERLNRVLVTMYGIPDYDLQEFANEVSDIKSQIRSAYTVMKDRRNHLARELNEIRAKVTALKKQVTTVTDRVRRLKRKAEEDAAKREERLRQQLRARIRAHRAGLDFVRKLAMQVKGLKESVSRHFGKQVASIQSTLLEFADDIEGWTGQDITSDVQDNRRIGTGSLSNRLYTKRHLTHIVSKMESKLRAAYATAKAALRRAKTPVVAAHVGRLEMLLNGLKSRLSSLEAKSADVATALEQVENGHPSLRQLRSEFGNVKAIMDQIYTEQRVRIPKVIPRVHGCVKAAKRVHRHFTRCRNNLRRAVLAKAPRTETYVLWKQYVVAKHSLQRHVRGCAKAAAMME